MCEDLKLPPTPTSSIREKWTNVKNLFALIIGIDNYPHATKLRGAVADADRFELFLRDNLKLEDNRTINLRNESATREKIEDGFCSLWNNESIKYDDPIVIYFAGHGCKIRRPDGWEAGGLNEIEGILPYDVHHVQSQESDTLIFPIPDRTIAAWLNILSYKKGNNIAVIFDCCHSASGARGGNELTRAETFDGSLPDGIDKTYFSLLHETVPPKFPKQHSLSHVFLAACGADESAAEVRNKGKFTTALLGALEKDDVDECTYAQFMRSLQPIPGQTPQCEGVLKNRLLFTNTLMLGWGVFPVSRTMARNDVDQDIYRIDAGSVHGVHLNSLFNMYANAAVHSETNQPICELCATRVLPLHTEATITQRRDEEADIPGSGFSRQKCSGRALKVHFTPALRAALKEGVGDPDNTLHVISDKQHADLIVNIHGETGTDYSGNTLNVINDKEDDSIVSIHGEKGTDHNNLNFINDKEESDLIVNIHGEKGTDYPDITLAVKEVEDDADFIVDLDGEKDAVFTTNLSAVVKHGFKRISEVVPAEPEHIFDVLRAASQWTQHLDPTNSNLIKNIEIEFYSLEKTTDEAGVTVINPKKTVPPIQKNAVSLTVLPDNEDMYGMVIRNKTNIDFHVSMVAFDIDSLVMQPCFSGALGVEVKGNADPSLRKGKDLTVGYGNGGAPPFMFEPPNGGVNVTILKLYFTSMPMDFAWLEQASPFEKVEERGAKPQQQVKQLMAMQVPQGATALFTVVQRAPSS